MAVLKKGSKGGDVKRIQARLKSLHHSGGAADGIFGPETEDAVKAFQEALGLVADGIVGPEMWKILKLINGWIFQAVPKRYDLRSDTRFSEGSTETWYVTRYRDWMNKDDVVFFWLGGVDRKERGIYGWGELKGAPYVKKGWKAHGVNLVYTRRFDRPLTIGVIEKNDVLSEMLILKMAAGTNFLLSTEELEALFEECKKHDPQGPELPKLD